MKISRIRLYNAEKLYNCLTLTYYRTGTKHITHFRSSKGTLFTFSKNNKKFAIRRFCIFYQTEEET